VSLRFLSFVWGFVIPGGSLSQRVVSLCPDFLTGDGTLGTEYRLRGERRKSQEGLDLLRDDLTASAAENVPRGIFSRFYLRCGWLALVTVPSTVLESLIFMQLLL